MIDIIMPYLIVSVTILITGIVLFFTLSFLFELPGRHKLDRIFETEEEKYKRKQRKRKIVGIYFMALMWLIIAADLSIYYFV